MRSAARIATAESCRSSALILVTYNSRPDDNYLSKEDRAKARMPILQTSTKRVSVANGGVSKAIDVTPFLFPDYQRRQQRPTHSEIS